MDDSIISITKLNNGIIKHENSKKKNHLISLCTSLEVKLADKKSRYFDKLQYLLTAWEQIVTFSETSTESPQPVFEFLFINTLRFVLRADWSRASTGLQTHFSFILQRLGNVLSRSEAYHSILGQCRVLESVVKNPWGHVVLGKILNSQDVDLNECAEYFNFENGKVIVIRLEMLLQSKCEDIAINLSKTCLHAYNSFNEDLEGFDTLDFTQDEIDYITDIYFSSLLKTKKKTELITEIKKYQLDDGLRLLQRYRTHSVGGKHNEFCKNARVWKCNKKLIDLLSSTLLANAVLHENLLESQSQLEELINEWAAVQTTNDVLPPLALEMIRKFVLIAPSSKCIYPFCSFLIRNVSCKEQDFNQVARCLIRAINQNMNEIEQYRVNQERDKLKETYNQLSKGFLLISELFNECGNIRKECLLTSFSLAPSRECLQIIEAFVKKLSNVLDEIKSEELEVDSVIAVPDSTVCDASDSHANTVPDAADSTATVPDGTDSAAAVVPDTIDSSAIELNEIFKSMGVRNDEVCDKDIDSTIIAKQVDVKKGLAPAYISEVESLKLEDSICEDLNLILRYQRYHSLSWDLPWDDLKINCEKYLDYFEQKGFDEVELKYLDLDYNQFKDQPVNYEDYSGIEKGYEQYAVSPVESEEELSSTRRSGLSSYDSDDEIILSYKNRRKTVNSDSEEPKVKKKRGRKPKIRDPDDPTIRRTRKKQFDNVLMDNQSDPNSLKALRQFRISGLKSLDLNDDEKMTKQAEELHSILEDSFKILDAVEIPPVSPRFNVYDVILNETLMPNSNETLIQRSNETQIQSNNETQIQSYNETQLPSQPEVTNNENVFLPDTTQIKPKPEKRKFFVTRERKRKHSEPKEPKMPKMLVNRMKHNNESYLTNGTFAGRYTTLLANDELFRRKYGSKPKNGQIYDESFSKDCVVQLPKLYDTFSNFNPAKKMLAMKPVDQNVTYSSYLNGSFVEPKSEDALTECNRNVRPYEFENGTVASTNTIPAQSGGITEIQLENIENMLSQLDGPPLEVNHNHEPIPAPMNDLPNGMGTENNDLNQALCDFVNDQLPSYSVSGIYSSAPVQKPVNNARTFATTSKLVSASPQQLVYNSNPIVMYGQNSTFVRSTAKKKNTKKVLVVNRELQQQKTPTQNDLYNTTFARTSPKDDSRQKVDQILNEYSTTIDKYPHLKTMPAPRQRTVPGVAKKSKSRKKNNHNILPHTFLPEYSTNQSVPYAVNSNVYCNNSKSELPISSTHTSSQIYTTQYQQMTETKPTQYYAIAQPMKTYISPKLDESSGTLKALLMQGTNNVDVSDASKAYESLKYNYTLSNNTKLQVLLPPLTSEAISFAGKQKTYSHYVISGQPSVKNQYTSLIDPVVMNDATNVSVCIPKLKLTTSTVAISNGNLIPSYNDLVTSSSVACTNVSQSYPRQLNSITAQVPNAQLKEYESMMNNFQVRIPRIDLQVDLSSYNKPNLYGNRTPVNVNYSSQQRINELSDVQVVQSNILDKTMRPLAADTSQIIGDVEEFNNILKNVQAGVHNNQFSMTSSVTDSKNDAMKTIVYVDSTEGAPQISIPENGFNLELDDYLSYLQPT